MTGNSETVFFRLLKIPIDDKGDALAAQIAALNTAGEAEETFALDPADFGVIPGSPFAYWAKESIFRIFREIPPAEGNVASFRLGLKTNDDFRFLRLFWEIAPQAIGMIWRYHCKGGEFSPYYYDVSLLLDWEDNAERLREFSRERGESPSRNIRSESHYFRPGLTWPRRTQKGLNVRALPADSIFADKGPAVFADSDDSDKLLDLLGILNSLPLAMLVELQMAFGSYEVGVLQRTPIPSGLGKAKTGLTPLVHEAHDLQRDRDRADETTHAFCLPGLGRHKGKTFLAGSLALEAEEQARAARLAKIQAEIDEIVFNLYGLSEADRALVREEMGGSAIEQDATEDEDEEDEPTPPEDLPARVENLLQWCVGVAFGRWDMRMALDPTLLPPLQGPFDPLPRCAPSALVGADGLPPAHEEGIAPEAWLRVRKNVLDLPTISADQLETLHLKPETGYPLPIAWDGILVDDPTHPSDIVTRVREVLALLWGDRAGAVEREACEILGFDSLRDYFRDARKGFFALHIKRYSKSRRKAPIYWLLQSDKRNYGIWLYIHRMRPDVLFVAGRDYADAKVALEETRVGELRQGLDTLEGSARRRREREIERQQKLVAEVIEFRDRLDRVALLRLPPDLNDGVTISIAPLWELVPWREAQKMWNKLVDGEYGWSTMSQQMRERGLVR
jgi:hypothetical protein